MAKWITTLGVALNQTEQRVGLPFGPGIPNTTGNQPPDEAFAVISARTQAIADKIAKNRGPVWQPGEILLTVGVPSQHNLKALASDPEGDPLTFRVVSGLKSALQGALTLTPDLILKYNGAAIPSGSTGLTIEASDTK